MTTEVVQIKDVNSFVKEVGDYVLQQIKEDRLKGTSLSEEEANEWYTREEVAKMFNVSLTTLHNWGKEKILNPHKVGNRVIYRKSEINALPKPVNA